MKSGITYMRLPMLASTGIYPITELLVRGLKWKIAISAACTFIKVTALRLNANLIHSKESQVGQVGLVTLLPRFI